MMYFKLIRNSFYKKNKKSLHHFSNIMKISVLLLFVVMFNAMATSVYGQNETFKINMQNVIVRDVLKAVEAKTGYRFFFSDNFADIYRIVSIDVESNDVTELLSQVFQMSTVTYKILDNNVVVITPLKTERQGITITGTVTDADGIPMPGVTVLVKGSMQATVTNANGAYAINAPDGNATLAFSFVGYASQEIAVGDLRVINVALSETTRQIEEVVVVGFGTQKKVNLTGAVGTVASTDLLNRPVQNAIQALQGLATGLNIQSMAGYINQAPTVNIRGTGNLGTGASDSPLVLIDGMEGDLINLNPHDIESISVLKDAAASSIYGSRAPFGVILVTTKKGTAGQVKVNYNNNFSWAAPTLVQDIADSYSTVTMMNDMYFNEGGLATVAGEWFQRIEDYYYGRITTVAIPDTSDPRIWSWLTNANVNVYDIMYNNAAFSHNHNLSASGGNDRLTFHMSMGFLDQNGLIRHGAETYKKYMPTGTVEAKMTDWLKIRYTTRFIRSDFSRPTALPDNSWGDQSSFYSQLLTDNMPYRCQFDDNGFWFRGLSLQRLAEGGRATTQSDALTQQASIRIDPVKNWVTTLEFNYGINTTTNHSYSKRLINHYVDGTAWVDPTAGTSATNSMTKNNALNMNVYTSYQFDLLQAHNFNVMAGGQLDNVKYSTFGGSRMGLINEDLPVLNLTTGLDGLGEEQTPTLNGSTNEWSTAGFFGRLNYDYKGRYLLEANLRYDGSSRFRDNKRWNWFPSVSAGWNIARENFWGDLTGTVNLLKIRGSWGSLGNQNTNSLYPTYQVMSININSGAWLQNGNRTTWTSSPNLISALLTWEKVQSWNIGLDAGAFNNRLTASFDWYQRKTLNMVGPAMDLPDILGKAAPQMNNTDLKTDGFELELAWQDRLFNDLSYSVRFLLSDYQTEVTRYPNESKLLSTYNAGQKLNNIWGYETIGIARSNEEMEAHLTTLPNGGQSALGSNWRAGDIMYKDANDDGRITAGASTLDEPGDRKVIGNYTPRYRFGLDIQTNWKGFDARIFFQGVGKRDYWPAEVAFFGCVGRYAMFPTKASLDYFRAEPSNHLPANTNAYYPRPLVTTNSKNYAPQTGYLQNAAYIRLKNISLGYTLPRQITAKFFVAQMRLFVAGENLWTGTKIAPMFEPESIMGLEARGDGYPLQKIWSFGLNITL